VVRVRASEERAALNLLAEASGFNPGVEEREDSVDDVVAMLACGETVSLSWESVAILNRENFRGRDLIT